MPQELPRRSGRTGAPRLYDIGDIGESLPGPKVAGAIAARVGEDRPEAILIGATYDGRDIAARLSARLDLPVLTNVVGLEVADGALSSLHAIFGGSMMLWARFEGAGPGIFVVRAKSFAGRAVRGGLGSRPGRGSTGDRGRRRSRHRGDRRGADRRPP